MLYIHPELRIWQLPFSIKKGRKAALEGATREHRASKREQEGALWGSAWAQQVGARTGCDESASVAYVVFEQTTGCLLPRHSTADFETRREREQVR